VLEQLLFYITEYWCYSLVFLFITLATFFFIKSPLCSGREDKPQLFVAIVGISYLILFSGWVGGAVRPYFNDLSKITRNGYFFRGTGSFVSPNIVMTNAHVVYACDSKKLAVGDSKNNFFPAEVLAILPENKGDVAFLKTNARREHFALFSYGFPQLNDIALFPNYTSKVGEFDLVKGKLVQIDQREMRFLDPKGRKGNSGSPVFNNKGYLIGILWGGAGFFKSETVVTNAKTILDFAKQNNVTLYSVKDQSRNLAKNPDFLEEIVVTILCARD